MISAQSCMLCEAPSTSVFCESCTEKRIEAFTWAGTCAEPSIIDTNLYLSKAHFAQNKAMLDAHKIKSILTVANIPPEFPGEYNYKVIKVIDVGTESIGKYFDEMCEFIHSSLTKNEAVLVHCGAGQSRSPTAVIAYLMKTKKWKLRQAYEHVIRIRPFVFPNEEFLKQLKDYERMLCD